MDTPADVPMRLAPARTMAKAACRFRISPGRFDSETRPNGLAKQADILNRCSGIAEPGGGLNELGAGLQDQLAGGDLFVLGQQASLEDGLDRALVRRLDDIPQLAQDVSVIAPL